MPSPNVPAGTKLTIPLVDLVAPWLGAVVYIHFSDGSKAKAKILSVTPEGAEVIALAAETKSVLDPPHLQD